MIRYRLALTLLILVALIVTGTVGYHLIEGWRLFDSLYMTVITLTTVGFREVYDLSDRGRLFTIFLSMGGVFTLFYLGTETVRLIVSGELRGILEKQRMEQALAKVKNHMIVCGYGRMGKLVCQEFSGEGLSFVVIDQQKELLEDFQVSHGIPLHGDATTDEMLHQAGIERARALVAVLGSDEDNLYITLSARLLNDKLFIVARADDERSEKKLLRAGASRVVSPYLIGGSRLAQAVLRPTVVDFIELATRTEHMELQIEETRIAANSTLAGASIKDMPTVEGWENPFERAYHL